MVKTSLRKKADKASIFRSRTLICVVEKPKTLMNLMGIIRSAEALGVSKIYLIDDDKLKLPNDWKKMRDDPRLLKLSASGIKWLFLRKFSSTSECLQHLSKLNFTHAGTSPHQFGKKNVSLSEGDYTQRHLAVWFGNESRGLSQEALKACDLCVQIPMYGIIESMNLSSSASVVLNHIVKKRHEFVENKVSKKSIKKRLSKLEKM
ncbi:TrmH family RNA methyltransferase [Nanoarchaeota archaeon]